MRAGRKSTGPRTGTNLTEVGVIHGLPGREAGLVIVAQQFVQEVQGLCADQVLVLAVDKPLPPFAGVSGGQTQEPGVSH